MKCNFLEFYAGGLASHVPLEIPCNFDLFHAVFLFFFILPLLPALAGGGALTFTVLYLSHHIS